jgi:hypothetical protein
MSKDSAKKRAKAAARWTASARPPAPKPEYACVRCGADIGHPAQQADHNATVHRAGPR